jgi:hypothetical protein
MNSETNTVTQADIITLNKVADGRPVTLSDIANVRAMKLVAVTLDGHGHLYLTKAGRAIIAAANA